jgi:hypothetical protein
MISRDNQIRVAKLQVEVGRAELDRLAVVLRQMEGFYSQTRGDVAVTKRSVIHPFQHAFSPAKKKRGGNK